MNTREPLNNGVILTLGSISYRIIELIGSGANAMVYKAKYSDGLISSKEHTVLIKELFPLHNEGFVYRDAEGMVRYKDAASDFFELHKTSFLHGSIAHLNLQELRADKAVININSYESNGTLYTILGYSGGTTLNNAVEQGALHSLYDITACMLNILEALKVFHDNGMLHLDISPDNVMLMPKDEGISERFRNVILIDYNSIWSLEELTNHTGFYYSIKECYSAPEVRLQDCRSICPATDLFSVCAIFLEYVQGKQLDFGKLTGRDKRIIDIDQGILAGCSATVVHKAVSIIRKGLKLPPNQRYQGIDELVGDFEELLFRLEGVGITHSALWEASKSSFHNIVERNSGYSYLKYDNMQSISKPDPREHCLIIGNSGMGKTAMLLRLWKNGVSSYQPNEPVPVYIPLYCYKNGILPFIKGTLLEKLQINKETSSMEEAMLSLNHLLDTPRKDNFPSVQLLLDGLNEVTGDKRGLYLELSELSKRKGVQLILTSRTEDFPLPVKRIYLPLIERTRLREILSANEVSYPEDDELSELLGNPMLLSLYIKISSIKQRNLNIHTMEELYAEYIDSLLLSHRQTTLGNDEEQQRAEYTVRYLLPLLAECAKKGNNQRLTQQEIYTVVKKCFNQLHSKSFLKAFPEYIGKVKAISGSSKSAEEWFQPTVIVLLKNKFALLSQDENGCYRLFHQSFEDYLNIQMQNIRKQLNHARIKYVVPYTITGLLLAAMLSLGAVKLINSLPGDYPRTKREINTVSMAMNSLIYTTGMLDLQISAEYNILNGIEDKLLEGDKESYRAWIKLKNRELKTIDLQEYNSEETERILNYLSAPEVPIPLEVLNELYQLPSEHKEQLYFMIEGLTEYMSPGNVYIVEDKKQIIVLYREWLDNYVTASFIKLQQVLEPLTPEARSTILEYLPYTAIFKEMLVNSNWSNTDYEAKLEACRTTGNEIASKLKVLGFGVEIKEVK